MNECPIVMLVDPPRLGRAVSIGAYASWIELDEGDKIVTELYFNDDFEFLEEE